MIDRSLILKYRWKILAALLVTHNAALAERCDKTIEVIDGRITGQSQS